MTESEKYVEGKLKAVAKKHGGRALKWVSPGEGGVPDRIVLLPDGRIYFVELKRPGGKPGKRQLWWADKLRALGFDCFFLLSAEDVWNFDVYLTLEEAGA